MPQYDSYADSQIPYVGLIPSHWKTVQNKRVMHKEKRICTSYAGQDIISLTMNGVIVRDLGAGGKMPATFDGYQFVYPGELLMCLFDIDVTPRCVGKVYNEGLTSPAYSSFVLHDNADLGFYYYYYLMLDHTKELLHLAKNLRHSLTEEQLGQIKVPLPPLLEQRAIAEFLDAKIAHIDSVITEAKASIEEYKAWKASIIYEAVTKGLDTNVEMKYSGIDIIGIMPSHWETCRLKYLCDVMTGNQDTQNADNNGEYPFYVRSPIVQKANVYTYEGEGILMAGDGAGAGRVFHHAFGKYAIHQRVYCFHNFRNINTDYFLYFISELFKKVMDKGSAQSTVPSVRLPMIQDFVFCIPPEEEQKMIVEHLKERCSNIDALISEKEALITDLESYKKSLIFEVVTGKRKVV